MSKAHRCLQFVLLGLFALPAAALSAADGDGVRWRAFDAAAFGEAASRGVPIVVNVGHEGCTACRRMEETTFRDPRVVALLNDAFVPIQVDSEAQPDIGERYSDWAWPATAFLKADGTQVFAIRGSRRPDDFAALLERVLARHRAGELKTDARAPYGAPEAPRDGPLEAIRAQARRQLDGSFDDTRGGWGSAKILETPAPALQLFWRAHLYDDETASARARLTAAGFVRQLDPVWGGLFYASFGRWDQVVPEKRLESQAAALHLFADALQVTGERRYADALANVHGYLRDWLRRADGAFFASQKAAGPALPDGTGMDDYYALDDAGRRARGLPIVDRAVYTDLNGRVVAGLVRAWEATGEDAFLDTARSAAAALLDERATDDGWLLQFVADGGVNGTERVHVVAETGAPYLRAQAYFGLGTLALYQATGERRWLEATRRIVAGMNTALGDPALGGWFGGPASALDPVIGRRKPLEDNAAAARLVYRLGVLDKDDGLRAAADAALRAAADADVVAREGRVTGQLALALELLTAGYVEISVVGDANGPAAQALLAAGRAVYEPRKIVHVEAPGRYPRLPHAAMYICNDRQCTLPITDPGAVAIQAAQFTPAALARVAATGSATAGPR